MMFYPATQAYQKNTQISAHKQPVSKIKCMILSIFRVMMLTDKNWVKDAKLSSKDNKLNLQTGKT